MTASIKANVDGSAAIQVGGVDAITLTSAGAASFVTSPMTIQGGSASAPSLTFSGDTNTGIFSPAADNVSITTGGTERLRVDSAGNAGLAVTPSAWQTGFRVLQIGNTGSLYSNNTAAVANNFYVDSGGTNRYLTSSFATAYVQNSSGQHIWYYAASGTAGNAITFNQALMIDTIGNLLVGTSSSDLAGAGTTTRISLNNATGFASTNVNTGTNAYAVYQLGNNNNANRAGLALLGSGFTSSGLLRQDGIYLYTSGAGGVTIAAEAAQPIYFATSNTERARITSDGVFLFRTTDPAGTTGPGFKIADAGVTYAVTAASTAGTNFYHLYSTGAGAFRFYVGAEGRVYCTNTTITAISDQRLKENIRDLDDGMSAIMALKPRKFDWKEGKGKDIKGDRGWIAQEFEQVFPDMVSTWLDEPPEGEEPYKSVGADLIPVLVKALQELKAELDATKAEVALLKGAA